MFQLFYDILIVVLQSFSSPVLMNFILFLVVVSVVVFLIRLIRM